MIEVMEDPAVTNAVTALLKVAEGDGAMRPGLKETPARFARAWEFFTKGYHQNPADVLKSFEDGAAGYDEMVVVKDIPILSLCEHHLLPWLGHAHIAYIPRDRILGLSKFPRLVEVFARRLQVQERVTVQIADALEEYLKPKGVGVILECRHLCMEMRGVQVSGAVTITDALRGAFKEGVVRNEFLSLKTGRI